MSRPNSTAGTWVIDGSATNGLV